MKPKFRAYDSGSLSRMYQPDEVMVGDIIKCTRGCPHEVYIEKEYAGTFIGGMPAIYLKGLSEGYAWTGDEEIIGNIYENQIFEEKR